MVKLNYLMLLNSIQHVYMYNPGYKKGRLSCMRGLLSVQVV